MTGDEQVDKKFTSDRHAPKQRRAQERVRQIIAATAHELHERGVEQTTTNHIAARAGLPVGSIYKYFTDKESILIALLEVFKQDMLGMITAATHNPFIPGATPTARMEALLYEFARYHEVNHPFELLSFAWADPGLKPKLIELQTALRQEITSFFQENSIADPELKAILALQYMRAYCELSMESGAIPEAARDHLQAVIVALVAKS